MRVRIARHVGLLVILAAPLVAQAQALMREVVAHQALTRVRTLEAGLAYWKASTARWQRLAALLEHTRTEQGYRLAYLEECSAKAEPALMHALDDRDAARRRVQELEALRASWEATGAQVNAERDALLAQVWDLTAENTRLRGKLDGCRCRGQDG